MSDFTGTDGNDNLTGTTGDDTFDISQGGMDIVNGGGGDDMVLLSEDVNDYTFTFNSDGSVTVAGPSEIATLTGVSEIHFSFGTVYNTQLGTTGNDTITLASTTRRVEAGPGDDTIIVPTGQGFLYIYGGTGSDTIVLPGNASSYSFDTQLGNNLAIYGARSLYAYDVEFAQFADQTVQLIYGTTAADGVAGSNGTEPGDGTSGQGASYAATAAGEILNSGITNGRALGGNGGNGGNATQAGVAGGNGGNGGDADVTADNIAFDGSADSVTMSLVAKGGDGASAA